MAETGHSRPTTVMVCSTMNDLVEERMAACDVIRESGLTLWRSESPPWTSPNARELCQELATRCDLYVLILGARYGFAPDGTYAGSELSAAELEYQAAISADGAKVLMLLKKGAQDTTNERQWHFIQQVLDRHAPQSRQVFESPTQLKRQLRRLLPPVRVSSEEKAYLLKLRALVERQLDLPNSVVLTLRAESSSLYSTSNLDEEERVGNVFASYEHGDLRHFVLKYRHLVLEGEPGSGKTTTLLQFVHHQISQLLDPISPRQARIPLFASANEIAFHLNRDLFLDAVLRASGLEPSKRLSETMRETINGGGATLIIDGLDEISEHSRESILQQLNQAANNRIVVSSRLALPDREALGWAKCQIELLDFEQIRRLAHHIIDSGSSDHTSVDADRFVAELHNLPTLLVQAGNPLFLSLLAYNFQDTRALPTGIFDLLERSLLYRLQGQGLWRREAALDFNVKLDLLGRISIWMLRNSTQSIDVSTAHDIAHMMSPEVNVTPGELAKFLHATEILSADLEGTFTFQSLLIQEFFAARLLSQFPQEDRLNFVQQHRELPQWGNVFRLLVSKLESSVKGNDALQISRLIYDEAAVIHESTSARFQSPKVFVSHSSRDIEFTRRIADDLRKAGVVVWVDYTGITDGNFLERIDEALSKSQWLILILTTHALSSEYVKWEVYAALNSVFQHKLKGVIPVIAGDYHDDDVPPLWTVLHRYDACKDYHQALTGVLRALGVIFE